jgi:hypothetical protein
MVAELEGETAAQQYGAGGSDAVAAGANDEDVASQLVLERWLASAQHRPSQGHAAARRPPPVARAVAAAVGGARWPDGRSR